MFILPMRPLYYDDTKALPYVQFSMYIILAPVYCYGEANGGIVQKRETLVHKKSLKLFLPHLLFFKPPTLFFVGPPFIFVPVASFIF